MTYREWPNPGRWLTENGQIPEGDLPRLAKSRKVTYREWPKPGDDLPRLAKSRKMTYRDWPKPGDDLPRFAKSRHRTSRNLERGFDETGSLKPSSGDERSRLVVSRNWLSEDWKTTVSHFDWTKPSQKSLSRCEWFYAPLVRLYH